MASGKEHQAEGMIDKVKGAVKEGFGALTGNRSTEAEGKAERAKGSLQEGYGDLKESLTSDRTDAERTGDLSASDRPLGGRGVK